MSWSTGALVSLPIFLPNVIWWLWPPREIQAAQSAPAGTREAWLARLESLARAAALTAPFFRPLVIGTAVDRVALVVMAAVWCVYAIGWMRYLASGRTVTALYAPMFGLPVPMAVAPAIYFAAASVVLHSPWLAAAAALLALTHIPLSLRRWQRLSRSK